MRVFYFARVDGAGEEAGARHVFEFCRHFAALGHAVTLFLPDLGKRRALESVSLVYVPVLIRRPAFTFFSFYFILFFFLFIITSSRVRMSFIRGINKWNGWSPGSGSSCLLPM